MNILFIWIGERSPLYEWRTKCIRRALEVYPEAHFTCITRLKRFFDMDIVRPKKQDFGNYMEWSDHTRMHWLMKNPYTLYLDTDTYCIKAAPLGDGFGFAGFEAIWNGEDTEQIRRVYEEKGNRSLLCHLAENFRGKDLTEYFEHKRHMSGCKLE